MRVLTWNIHSAVGIDRRPSVRRIAKTIAALAPDVVGLNEVRAVPVLRDAPRVLERLLGMRGVFQPNVSRPLMRFGNLVLTRGEIVGEALIPLPGSGEQRGLLLAEVELDGERLTFGSTHLGLDVESRRRQKEAILDALPRGAALVLAGDFNERPDALGALAERLHLAGAPPSYPVGAPSAAIDLILVSDRWRVERVEAVPTTASDHYPVFADIVRSDSSER